LQLYYRADIDRIPWVWAYSVGRKISQFYIYIKQARVAMAELFFSDSIGVRCLHQFDKILSEYIDESPFKID
jgi:hypothetical protein